MTEAFETAAFDSGLVAGVRTQINYASRAKRYTVGPAVEVSLPFGLALEFDALYKRLDYNFSSSVRPGLFGTFNEEQDNIVSRWDLPLLLKYRVRTFGSRTPYVSAGLNTNYIVNTTQLSRAVFTPSSGVPVAQGPPVKTRNPPAELKYRSAEGVVIAAGLEFCAAANSAALRPIATTKDSFRCECSMTLVRLFEHPESGKRKPS